MSEELKSQILNYLACANSPSLTALQISKGIYGEAGRAKHVNSTLYKLRNSGILIKSGSGKPLWSLANKQHPGARAFDSIDEQILTTLRSLKRPITVKELVSMIDNPESKSQVNKKLYSFLNQGLTLRVDPITGGAPLWMVPR